VTIIPNIKKPRIMTRIILFVFINFSVLLLTK
jgi:hypothetical protein